MTILLNPFRFGPSIPADTGFVLAGTGANITGVGTEAWATPGNVTLDDGNDAQTTDLDGLVSNYLKGTNYGLTVPGGSPIVGIEVQVEVLRNTSSSVTMTRVRIVDAAGVIGTNDEAGGESFPDGVATILTFGSSSNLWALSWTATNVNDADFGFVISATGVAGAQFAACDFMKVKVHYLV